MTASTQQPQERAPSPTRWPGRLAAWLSWLALLLTPGFVVVAVGGALAKGQESTWTDDLALLAAVYVPPLAALLLGLWAAHLGHRSGVVSSWASAIVLGVLVVWGTLSLR